MNHSDYQRKLEEFCVRTGMNPTIAPARQNTAELSRLLNLLVSEHHMSSAQANFLKTSDPAIPNMIAKVKTHKPGFPLRGIINCRDSLTYGLESWLSGILNKLLAYYPRKVKNSKFIYDSLAPVTFPAGSDLYSWDIKDLYPSIIPTDIIPIVLKFNIDFPSPGNLDNHLLEEIMRFCLQPKTVQVGSEYYTMSSGVAMGSPLSAVLANFQMWDMEDQVLPELGSSLSHYFRYADEILVFCHANAVNRLHSLFNAYRPNSLQFLQSDRVEGWLPYLDLSLKISRDRTLLSTINLKPTSTYNYLKYTSFGPHSQKTGVIHTVLNRISNLASPQFKNSLFHFFKSKLILNGYPTNLIYKTWHKINFPTPRNPRPQEWVKLPYIKEPRARNAITNSLLEADIGAVYTGGKSLKTILPSLYPSLPAMDQRNVIYDIPFEPPSSGIYTGQSGRTLYKRLAEHASDLRRNSPASSLVAYCNETGATPDFSRTRIITRAATIRARLLNESVVRDLHLEKAVSKINPIRLRPPTRNFAGIYSSSLN